MALPLLLFPYPGRGHERRRVGRKARVVVVVAAAGAHPEHGAWRDIQIGAEILGDHRGRVFLDCESLSPGQRGGPAAELPVVDHRGGAALVAEFGCAAVGPGRVRHQRLQPPPDVAAHRLGHGPHGALQFRRLRRDVPGVPRRHPGDGQHSAVEGIDPAADDALGRGNDGRQRGNRVISPLGIGGVAALADDLRKKAVGGGHHRPGPHAQRSRRIPGIGVPGKKQPHVIQQPRGHHQRRAPVHLLGGLEDHLHRAGQRRLPGLEQQRRPQHAGGVEVVAAGMHEAGSPGCVVQVGLLADGQRVDVRPQGHGRSPSGSQFGNQPRFKARLQQANAVFNQYTPEVCRGLTLLHGQLRIPVQPPEHLRQPFLIHARPLLSFNSIHQSAPVFKGGAFYTGVCY